MPDLSPSTEDEPDGRRDDSGAGRRAAGAGWHEESARDARQRITAFFSEHLKQSA
jgi:hypothetical protein